MNGLNLKAVIDTNILFMALYDPNSKAGRIIKAALENKIELYSPDSVKEEIKRVLQREIFYSDKEVEITISSLPIKWIEKEIYIDALPKTKVKHLPDKPIEALSIILNCGILSANFHFKDRLDINKVLEKIEE